MSSPSKPDDPYPGQPGPVSRRDFLKLVGASAAMAGLGGCAIEPAEEIVPYVRPPEEIVPGKPLFFATAMSLGGFATGLLVESHEGRPTKVEGNPDHPDSLGAADAFSQASVLTLYDPDRSQAPIRAGSLGSWESFLAELSPQMEAIRRRGGAGLAVLTETIGSPTLADQLRSLLAALPAARWHQYEPAPRDSALLGPKLAFGELVETRFRFDRAQVILGLDADFLSCVPGGLRHAREFAGARRVRGPSSTGGQARM